MGAAAFLRVGRRRRQTARRRRIDSAQRPARPNLATIGGFPCFIPSLRAGRRLEIFSIVSMLRHQQRPDLREFPERAFINNSSWICHEAPA
jgi:hypothetical protein